MRSIIFSADTSSTSTALLISQLSKTKSNLEVVFLGLADAICEVRCESTSSTLVMSRCDHILELLVNDNRSSSGLHLLERTVMRDLQSALATSLHLQDDGAATEVQIHLMCELAEKFGFLLDPKVVIPAGNKVAALRAQNRHFRSSELMVNSHHTPS